MVAPAANYMDLKLNIGTYCGLLWTIFGHHCDYYIELLKLFHILDCKECFTMRHTYMKEVCARITWAIVDNGRSFFGCNPLASDFCSRIDIHFFGILFGGSHGRHPECKSHSAGNFPLQMAASLYFGSPLQRATSGLTSDPLGKPSNCDDPGPGLSSEPGTVHPQGGHATSKHQTSYGSIPKAI
jgi:hypothetical protein